MATTAVDICNSALAKIGLEPIVALTDTNPRAVICNQVYTKLRDKLLRSHPWKWTLVRAQLTADPTAPSWGYAHRYPVPNDCLRIVGVDSRFPWVVEQGWILTDDNEMNIRYIQAITDVTKFDPMFAEVLAWAIANDICYTLTTSNTLKDQISKEYEKELAMARSFDAQQQSTQIVQSDDWLLSRF